MTQVQEERGRYITQAESQEIIGRVLAFAKDGYTRVTVSSWLDGELRWARNRVNLASDRYNIKVGIGRYMDWGFAGFEVSTNQIDDTSLECAVRAAERRYEDGTWRHSWGGSQFSGALESPKLVTPTTVIWSDVTSSETGMNRGRIARMLTEGAEAKGMLSAGYLEARSASFAVWSNIIPGGKKAPHPEMIYQQLTQAQCSMTVRHPRGMGSGWAGASSFDITRVDGPALAQCALDKCIASLDAVRIEPGRFTVILEPQAVSELLLPMMEEGYDSPLDRVGNEGGDGPFFLAFDDVLRVGRSKLGLKIIDERITISHDPMDPVLGVVTQPGLKPITWIQNGVLTSLHHRHDYAVEKIQRFAGDLYRPSFRVSGGDATIDDMIATTKRGLLVTRFSGIEKVDKRSVLLTGTTRDGLWLIENGVITKAVWNMRFTESPLFALNQLEQLGVPQPVFRPVPDPVTFRLTPTIVPAMKINDFSFTSLTDAV